MSNLTILPPKESLTNNEAIEMLKALLIALQARTGAAVTAVSIVCVYEDGSFGSSYVGEPLATLCGGLSYSIKRICSDMGSNEEEWI